jgi:NADPH2:quinone reductase
MGATPALSSLQLRSQISSRGELRLWLEEVPVADPGPSEVLIRVEAAPLNPSDITTLLGPVDLSTLRAGGTSANPTLNGLVHEASLPRLTARLDRALTVGNEGAGTIVAAGAQAQHLIGQRVAALTPPGMFAQYCTVAASACLILPAGATTKEAASALVNPLTVLGMIETMRREGHNALVHTAAASNLGQMLNRLCTSEGIPLVNIVRSKEQTAILRDIGANHVVDSSSPDFFDDLVVALRDTGATLAFDAIGGGSIASTVLTAMERAVIETYGGVIPLNTYTHKQIYLYGMLDTGPTQIDRAFGPTWSVGGWLMTRFIDKIGLAGVDALRKRIVAELTTTFASSYAAAITLPEALRPDTVRAYAKRATGGKYLITP